MIFEIVGEITDIETIAVGGRIRDIERLRKAWLRTVAQAQGNCFGLP
ncbi:MAG: hypothetical protein ACR2GW_03770 [Pyrinomonadaceae bacterium]|jgi:hypothetical protein